MPSKTTSTTNSKQTKKASDPGGIPPTYTTKAHKDFHADPINLLSANAVTRMCVTDVAMNRNAVNRVNHHFSHQVPNEGKATNQMASGRCWLFAALNVMRLPLMKKYKLEEFEFSQAYLFFWDKFEKANYFLESIIETRHEPVNSRLVSHLLAAPVSDGGQWDPFVDLVDKYGCVPKSVMPEIKSSGRSAPMNWILKNKLREFAVQIRTAGEKKATVAALRSMKKEQLQEIYRILAIHLGPPPLQFDWQFRDKNKKFHSYENLTPFSFLKKHVPFSFHDKVALINAPTKDKPFYKLFGVDHVGSVQEGKGIRYVNLPIGDLKKYAIASLKAGEPVWFGCDVGKHFHRDLGVMDMNLYDYEMVYQTKLGLSKAQRLDYGESAMSHAMVLTAVDLKKGEARKWRIENSWGDKGGDKGYFMMTDEWFDEFVYEVAVDKKYLPKKVTDILKSKPQMLPPWDPMGNCLL